MRKCHSYKIKNERENMSCVMGSLWLSSGMQYNISCKIDIHLELTTAPGKDDIKYTQSIQCAATNIGRCAHVWATLLLLSSVHTNGLHSANAQQTQCQKVMGPKHNQGLLSMHIKRTFSLLQHMDKRHKK